jgi:hypothetical protein
MMRRQLLRGIALATGWRATRAAPARRTLTAAEFWDLYFRDAFVRLQRSRAGMSGEVLKDGRAASVVEALRGIGHKQQTQAVEAGAQVLRAYDDRGDPRFDIFPAWEWSLEAASLAVVEGRYPYRAAAPFAPERLGIVVEELRRAVPAVRGFTVAALARWLDERVVAPGAQGDQRVTAAAWLLGERRDPAAVPALLQLLRHARPFEPAERAVASVAAEAAWSALGKIADPSCLAPLLELMKQGDSTLRWKCARLFEWLLSTTTLLGSSELGDRFPEPATWAPHVEEAARLAPEAWDRRLGNALHWELRALASLRCAASDRELLLRLADDEVGAVRRLALKRLGR